MDLGPPISYMVLEPGTPVYTADEQQIGHVTHVLAAEDEDVFDGIVIEEHLGRGGHRFVDAEQVADIHQHGVLLKLDRAEASSLPEPSPNPAVMRDDPADTGRWTLSERLKRAWELISGKD